MALPPEARAPKVKKKKPYVRPRTTRTDVQSSGGNYGIPKANKYKKTKPYKKAIAKTYAEQPAPRRAAIRHHAAPLERKVVRKQERQTIRRQEAAKRAAKRATARRTGATSEDLAIANRYKAKHPETFDFKARRKARHYRELDKTAPQISKAGISVADKGLAKKTLQDAIDIPANIIPTVAHIADPVVKHPLQTKSYVKTAGRTATAVSSFPIQLVKHPRKTISEHPLNSVLLVAPIPKIPIRGVRAVQRRPIQVPKKVPKIGGKTYYPIGERPKADVVDLPGTRMKENRPVTTGYARNIQKRIKKPSPTVTGKEIETRIDENVARMESITRRESAKTAKKTYKQTKKHYKAQGLPKKEAKARAGEQTRRIVEGLEQRIRAEQKQRVIDMMGLTERPKVRVNPNGLTLIKQGGNKAKVYKTEAMAKHAADKAKVGDVEFHPVPSQGGYVVMPKVAMSGDVVGKTKGRWEQHTEQKDFSPAGAVARMYSTQWRRNVLALHPTWYTGNVIEAALRAAVGGVGPMSFYRGHKVASALKTINPVRAEEIAAEIYGGGHLAMQANLPREYHMNVSGSGTLAKGVRVMQEARQGVAPIKHTLNAFDAFSDFTMGTLSGGIEGFFQKGMMGKALSKDPIMDGHMIKTTKKAIEDAARGLQPEENAVKIGRVVDEMYGKYGKFSPHMRRMIANYTPFISWTMNAFNFIYRTLPRDHPVLTALAASVQPYADEWLKDQGLSKFAKGAVPSFLQGAVPTKEGFARYPTRYTPFSAAAQYPEDIASLILPQYSSSLKMLSDGLNWKGQKVKNPDGTPLDPIQRSIAAALYLYEGVIPASQQWESPGTNYEKGARTPGEVLKPNPTKEWSPVYSEKGKIKAQLMPPRFDPFKKVPPPKDKSKATKEKGYSIGGNSGTSGYSIGGESGSTGYSIP